MNTFKFASLLATGVLLFACSLESGTNSGDDGKTSQKQTEFDSDSVNVLTTVFPSPKEKNPYSVENMNNTFREFILEVNPDAVNIPELEANFLYVRFLPYGKQEEYELKTYDSALVLFRHPMDYNDIPKPVVYVDETLPDSIIPYFAAVPVGYEFGKTPYAILQELFLTQPLEEDTENEQMESYFVRAQKLNKMNQKIADYLNNQGLTPSQLEAFIRFKAGKNIESAGVVLSKNNSIDIKEIVAWSLPFTSKWKPKGTLKFQDEKLNVQPLVGVRVIGGYSYYWREAHTDKNGIFSIPEKWSFSIDYELNFDSQQFLLQNGHSWYGEDLEIEKNNKKSAWNETFTGDKAKWSVVWTAAYTYWYGNRYGLKKPRQNTFWNQSLEINVYWKNNSDYKNKYSNGSIGMYKYGTFHEHIGIQAYNRLHQSVYATTIHEIAHSSHYDNAVNSLGEEIFAETYARGIERYLTIKRYGKYEPYYITGSYTGLFEDLEDNDNRFANKQGSCDKISGFTASMVEKSLFSIGNLPLELGDSYWNKLKIRLMADYPNGSSNGAGGKVSYTKADMDNLFKYWNNESVSCAVPVSSSSVKLSSNSVKSSSSSVKVSSSSAKSSSSVVKLSSSSAVSSSSILALSSSSFVKNEEDGPYLDFRDSRDGYVYKTTKIGSQIWMAENLQYNADSSRCYNDDSANCEIYGKLYNWATAMNLPANCDTVSCSNQIQNKHQGVCPDGWHIPTLVEWNKLILYANGNDGPDVDYNLFRNMSNRKLQSTSSLWIGYKGTDDFGFSVLPSGEFYSSGNYGGIGSSFNFWGATEGRVSSTGSINNDYPYYAVYITNLISHGGMYGYMKTSALSIRCIKD
ncbi:MAG: fibrobacter succinogenes major paralogous domain-containing protein [Fibrobacter sp.]|nr:fibrobacter succinogenes major paralogous domain-containing protein [Fibrobacter sp.]